MLPIPDRDSRIYLKPGRTDMRKSINGLAAIVEHQFKLNLFENTLFVFCNRKKDILKALFWERNGFCLWHKRLEKDRFPWPDSEAEALEITAEQLTWLLNGIDFRKAHQPLIISKVT
jgi:transposase